MTTPFASPAAAWQRVAACTDRTIAITCEDTEELNYHALIARAAALIPELSRLGVERGEPVLITAHTTMEFLSCFFGLMLYGAAPVPVPPRQTLKTTQHFLTRLTPLLKHHRRLICTPAEQDDVRTTGTRCQVSTFSALEDAGNAQFGCAAAQQLARSGTAEWPLCGLDDDAFIQYTSGSTAAPRGVVITYRNMLANVAAIGQILEYHDGDVATSWLPMYHDMGLVATLLAALFNGISAVFTTPQWFLYDPLGFLRLLTSSRATHTAMPNFALEWLITARNRPRANVEGIDLHALRRLIIGSEPVYAETMGRFVTDFAGLGLGPTALGSTYGLAEATAGVAISAPGTGFRTDRYKGTAVVTGGRVLDGFEVSIDAPEGEQAGTIRLRGDSVSAKAYVGGKKVNALDAQGFYVTGDLGYLVNNELVILGRQDEVFIVHGENKFPYDIESIIRWESSQHASKVACFGVNKRIVVVLENRSDTPPDATEAERLRRQLITATGLQLDELIAAGRGAIPVTTSGKIKRKAVVEAYLADTLPRLATHTWAAGAPAGAPRTPAEVSE